MPRRSAAYVVNRPLGRVALDAQKVADERRRQHMKGRPQITITEEQLPVLLDTQFSIRDIARMLQVSPTTENNPVRLGRGSFL